MSSKSGIMAVAAFMVCLVASGCTVSTSKNRDGSDKDVDIKTPLGSISVHKGEGDAKATGLSAYPGAQAWKDEQGDEGANVNLSSSMFGVKVAVAHYRTDDSPDKVLNFYRKDMAKYGKVVDCTGGVNMSYHRHDSDSEVTCDNAHGGRKYQEVLRVGTENNQRNMAIRPRGNGTEFTLVYVRAWDDKSTM